jgi:spore maturation protein CgeB
MRIFYASGRTPNQAIRGSQLWRSNLLLPLIDLRHEVVEFDYDLEPLLGKADFAIRANRNFIQDHRPHAEQELLRQILAAHREKPIQLFFSYFYSSCARAKVIEEIRAMGILTVNWYCNASYQLRLVQDIAPAYDYCLVPEKFRLDDYRRLGANPIYCQEAANPNIYKPYNVPRDLDVVFVGARYADRPNYIRRLLDAGVQVRVWGDGWSHTSNRRALGGQLAKNFSRLSTGEGLHMAARYLQSRLLPAKAAKAVSDLPLPPEVCGNALSDEEMIKTYSRGKVSLGFSTVGQTHLDEKRIMQIRLRDFEAPMSGAFYMVEYMPELEEFFEIGKEIVCYTDPDDLIEKCRYYLAHDAEREQIRLAGHRRAVSDHSWHRRFESVFKQMGLTS